MPELQRDISAIDVNKRYTELFKILRSEYTEKKMPLSGAFELTPHCTLDCKMCYVHSSSGVYPGRILSGDEWISIIDDAVDAGMLYATLTGGECMLHPDFYRIYEHLKNRGVFTAILSNGTLIDKDAASFFSSLPPRLIRISVYGSNPESYERVTGSADAFYAVDKAFDLLDSAGVVTDISITVSRYNYEDFENILQYAATKPHAKLVIDCDMQEPRGETGKNLADFSLSLEEQEKIWRTYFRINGKQEAEPCDDELGVTEPLPKKEPNKLSVEKGVPCTAGRCAFSVLYNGVMMPCHRFELARADLTETGFGKAWEQISQAAAEYLRSAECLNCEFLNACRFCPAVYSIRSLGNNGLPGNQPCNIKQRTLQYEILKNYGGN